MKICKVDHTRPAVDRETGSQTGVSGILYYNPDKDGTIKRINTKARVEELSRNARKLYSILNANDDFEFLDKNNFREEKSFCRKAVSNFKILIQGLMKKHTEGAQIDFLKNLDRQIIQMSKKSVMGKDLRVVSDQIKKDRQRALIRSLVMSNTRKSFRKFVKTENSGTEVDLIEVTDRILWSMCCVGTNLFLEALDEIGEQELRIFLNVLKDDFYKVKQTGNIVKSIQNQNVKVQTGMLHTKSGMEICGLRLSNADHKRKQYISRFVQEFAEGNEKKKQELFCYFKRIIVLFYCGSKKYEEVKAEEIADWEFQLTEIDEFYSREAIEKLNEKDSCDNLEKRKVHQQMRELLKRQLHTSYKRGNMYLKQKYADDTDAYEQASYWLSYIKRQAWQLLIKNGKANGRTLTVKYLCDYTWSEWISFICMKYIDMGKAVYHFAMPDLNQVGSMQNTVIGEVKPQYRNGLTSFDYERIKAYERFDREISIYITFAVNNFAKAALDKEKRYQKGNEDVLNLDFANLKKGETLLRPDAVKRILQFFGGQSSWEGVLVQKSGKEPVQLTGYDTKDFYEAFRQQITDVRNSSFHYTAIQNGAGYNELIHTIFEQEYKKIGWIICKKYYSNNVPMFYAPDEIKQLMAHLYQERRERPAQIPGFEKIIKRKDFDAFIYGRLTKTGNQNVRSMSQENMQRFYSSLYFVLKEIYYYGFLQENELAEKFMKSLNDYVEHAQKNGSGREGMTKKKAAENFQKRILAIRNENPNGTLGEICQQIMTDYAMQNNREMKVETSKHNKSGCEKSYEHFPLILQQCIRDAFCVYLSGGQNGSTVYEFLRTPKDRTESFKKLSEREFCSGFETQMYGGMHNRDNSDILPWYTLAHFLNQRQLNQMAGTFRSHIQFLLDIDRRSQNVSKGISDQNTEGERLAVKYRRILEILEFALLFCGQMTNCPTDYFNDRQELAEEEYAKHLAKYVAFETEQFHGAAALKDFCSRRVEHGLINEKIGLYYDAKNPVLNKNIIKAMMYGNGRLLEACVEPITEEEIQDYYDTMHNLKQVFHKKETLFKWEQEKLRKFQNKKNRVELTNVVIYMEILSELMGQLISWAYLRERDLMYFQLGYYYIKLYYGNSIPKEDKRRCLKGEGFSIADGAVLYQIAAMYTYHLPIYIINSDSGLAEPFGMNVSTGSGVTCFIKAYGGTAYLEGIPLFLKRKEAKKADRENDENIEIRNYLDHFKYFSHLDRSMLELYSIMFDRFLSYSPKLHKSVPVVLKNILAKHFVIANLDFGSKRIYNFKTKKGESEEEKARVSAVIQLKERRVSKKESEQKRDRPLPELESDYFTYKVKDKRKYKAEKNKTIEKIVEAKIQLDARGEIFLRELERILLYSLNG